MRYPINDFEEKWYSAQGFGVKTLYGYHEGCDLNLKTGGGTDLGQPIFSISDYKVVYYHIGSHPTTGFGIHYVYQIDGEWGTRWVHCCHNQSVKFSGIVSGRQGEELSSLGKSGTSLAHLHFAIFKVDPAILPKKIDSIAHNLDEHNKYWEDPILFIKKYLTNQADIEPKITDDTKIELPPPWNTISVRDIKSNLNDLKSKADQFDGFVSKWLAAWQLAPLPEGGLHTIEVEMGKLMLLEDAFTRVRDAAEILLGRHYDNDDALIDAIGAVDSDFKKTKEELKQCQLKLEGKKLIRAFKLGSLVIKVYTDK